MVNSLETATNSWQTRHNAFAFHSIKKLLVHSSLNFQNSLSTFFHYLLHDKTSFIKNTTVIHFFMSSLRWLASFWKYCWYEAIFISWCNGLIYIHNTTINIQPNTSVPKSNKIHCLDLPSGDVPWKLLSLIGQQLVQVGDWSIVH